LAVQILAFWKTAILAVFEDDLNFVFSPSFLPFFYLGELSPRSRLWTSALSHWSLRGAIPRHEAVS